MLNGRRIENWWLPTTIKLNQGQEHNAKISGRDTAAAAYCDIAVSFNVSLSSWLINFYKLEKANYG